MGCRWGLLWSQRSAHLSWDSVLYLKLLCVQKLQPSTARGQVPCMSRLNCTFHWMQVSCTAWWCFRFLPSCFSSCKVLITVLQPPLALDKYPHAMLEESNCQSLFGRHVRGLAAGRHHETHHKSLPAEWSHPGRAPAGGVSPERRLSRFCFQQGALLLRDTTQASAGAHEAPPAAVTAHMLNQRASRTHVYLHVLELLFFLCKSK